MATKFVDQLGISHIFSKIKTLLSGKADNDLSNINATSGRSNLGLNDAIVGLSVSGKTITYTQADGGTGKITTQDTNTTYSAMSASEATTGTATTSRSITAKVLHDKINEVVTAKAYSHPSTHPASMITGLSAVATSGSYNDLSNKPTIPTIPSSLPANGGNADTVGGFTVGTNVPADAKFTDTVYTLPNATSNVLGGVKVGTNISVSSGTISVANGSTSAKGVVQLTNSTSSTSTTTAATPNSVKSAYDLAKSKQSPATTLSGYGITDAYTKTEVDAKVSELVDSAPETLNTLNELAAALGDDPNFATTIATQIGTKANSADLATVATSGKYSDLSGTPSSLPANGGNAATVGGFTVGVSVPADAKFTDTVYTLPTASSTLGGVKTTSTVTSTSGLTACPIIGGVPYYKDTNNTYSLSSFGVTATKAELNVLDGITATTAELNYCDGVTSNIQTQLNGKLSTSGTAAKATADASGNNIANTYAKKAELATAATTDEIDAILV